MSQQCVKPEGLGGMTEGYNKCKILIVEDGLVNLHILCSILEHDYDLYTVMSAKEMWRVVEEINPHLILLDIILPDGNGFDILVDLKNKDEVRNIPVIVITGLDSDKDEEQGFLLGAVDYIKKPFNNAIVKARINTQIRLVRQMQTIESLSLIDPLTGAANRRAFENQLTYEWARAIREGTHLGLLMLDIDHFKNYNDSYGHPQGDVLLQNVAGLMKDTLKRSVDILCRYGGEEFVILLPGTDLSGAGIVAENVRKAVESLVVISEAHQKDTRVTVSIGVSSVQPDISDDLSAFIKLADERLYHAKRTGRNKICFELD